MRFKWQIVTILLAVVVVALSINTLSVKPTKQVANKEVSNSEVVIESIMTRSSVRNYTEQRVSDDMVTTMLKAGMAAPTAGNRQPWEFYVVRDTNIIKQTINVSKYTAPMNQIAQLAIVVCGVPSESFPAGPTYWVQDVSAATENILLAAHGLGLGAVWCGVYPGEDRVATLRGLLDVPEKLEPFCIIMIGHPKDEPKIKDKWRPERVHYIGK